jgi:PTH1 family peptidyl-tRNA hydrolase
LAIHDDLALDFGVVRTRKSGSDAGNNGLKSLISVFGKDFPRIKIGIANDFLAKMDSADFVLAKFSKAESEKLPQIFEVCESFVDEFLKNEFSSHKISIF